MKMSFLDSMYMINISWACLILKHKNKKTVIKPLQQFIDQETEVEVK